MAEILLVDDDQMLGKALEMALARAGHRVSWAHDGKEAAQMIDPKVTDLVITDLIMPEKEGIQLITEFHKTWPALKIIAISGGGRNSPDGFLKVAHCLGAQRTLTKPFSMDELLCAVDEVLQEKTATVRS